MDFDRIDQVLLKYEYRHADIISIMQDIQGIENYISEETIRYIAEKMELNLARVYDIATFYKAFSLVPKGRHTIKVCCGTACHLGGSDRTLDQINRLLKIKEGETTGDRLFSLETVNCLGTCALAPVVMVEDDYYDEVKPGRVEKILSKYRAESKG